MSSVLDAVMRAIPTSLIYRLQANPLVANAIRSVVNLAVPNELTDVTVAQGPMRGSRLSLDLRKEKAFWLGTYELDVQRVLCERLRLGAIAWDVGAFIGYHTLLMCRLCGPANVVAVEPDPDSMVRLRNNLSLNGIRDARVVTVALGSHVGRGILRKDALDRRQNFVEEVVETKMDEMKELQVDVKTLDFLLKTYGPPTLIKADVEGAEDLMLQGATRLLEEVRPFWILEAHGGRGHNAIEVLREKGYGITYLRNEPESEADLSSGQSHVMAEP